MNLNKLILIIRITQDNIIKNVFQIYAEYFICDVYCISFESLNLTYSTDYYVKVLLDIYRNFILGNIT